MEQTLAQGRTSTSRWGKLGGYRGRMVQDPMKIRGMIVGLPGEGKSCFLQSCSEAFVFNLDRSSTTTPEVKATIWPYVSLDGACKDSEDGESFVLSWDQVREKIELLKSMAKGDEDRPQLIVFDSLTEWIRMLVHWIPRHAKDLKIHSENVDDWKQINGQAGWDYLYNLICNTIVDLHNHGYGVYLVGHVLNEVIPIGDNKYSFKPMLNVTAKFWRRLFDTFELVAFVYRDRVIEQRVVEEVVRMRGQERKEKKRVSEEVTKYFLTIQKEDFDGVLKGRVVLPETIELPHTGSWDTFESEYRKAMASKE